MIAPLVCLLLTTAIEPQGAAGRDSVRRVVSAPTAQLYEAAYRQAFRTRGRHWRDAPRWHIDGVIDLSAVAARLRRTWPRVTARGLDESDDDRGYLTISLAEISLISKRRAEILVRVHRRGPYDHVHRRRGYNLWEWTRLRARRPWQEWIVRSISRWEHS